MPAYSLVSSARAPNHGAVCPHGRRDDQRGGGESDWLGAGVVPLLAAAPHVGGGPDAVTVGPHPWVFHFSVPGLIISCNIGHCLLPLYFPCSTLLFSTC